jgi:hypothetical protein
MKQLRAPGRFGKGHASNVVKFPVTSRTAAEHWHGKAINLVPASVLANVWAARRVARQDPAAAFAETVQRCLRTIEAAKRGGAS